MHTPLRSTAVSMLSAIVVLGFNLLAAAPPSAVAASPPAEWDGLTRAPDKGADHLYLLKGADFSGYNQVKVNPTQVAFDKNWKPNERENNPQKRVTDADMDRIRNDVATEFHKIFETSLSKAGYVINAADGENVLTITPAIVNLYVTAPKTQEVSGRSRTFVANSGHMTLVLELRDSLTGQLLGRVVDTEVGRRRAGGFDLASPVTNYADARMAMESWSEATINSLAYAKESSPAGTALAQKPAEGGQPR